MRAYICTSPSAVDIRTDRSGIAIGCEEDHGVRLEEMKGGGAMELYLGPGQQAELFHLLRLDLPGRIEVEMKPEIGNETSFVFFGHRRVDDSRSVCDRVYLARDGKWKPVTEGFAKAPADAVRVNLVSIIDAMQVLQTPSEQ